MLVTAGETAGGVVSPALDGEVAAWAREWLGEGDSAIHQISGRTIFVDLYAPPPVLLIVGAGEDSRPLARLAIDLGFRVSVVDRRPALLEPDRFPAGTRCLLARPSELQGHPFSGDRCHAVVMTHNFEDDREYLRALLAVPLAYLGVLGPRQRTERILRGLEAELDFDEGRVYGPIGLDIGTEGAEQVALSILAEILAVRSGRAAGSLRDRVRPIHALAG
jgi:xanthine/CO dehydrogenase XdhC/CoxF family maturation factor